MGTGPERRKWRPDGPCNQRNLPAFNQRDSVLDSRSTGFEFQIWPGLVLDPVDGQLYANNVKDWKYGIAIELNLVGISSDAIKAGKAVPPIVIERLQRFTGNGFSISHLFADLTNTDLIRFDPEITSVGSAGQDALNTFAVFMTTFLVGLKKDPDKNPIVLGYTIVETLPLKDPDADVPDSLKPIGQTFTVYKDPILNCISNANFILNTKGGQGHNTSGIHPTPGIFDDNWLDASEQCDGKMIYSNFCLLETLILRPFYINYASSCHAIIANAGLEIKEDPSYEQAVSPTPTGQSFVISSITTGDN